MQHILYSYWYIHVEENELIVGSTLTLVCQVSPEVVILILDPQPLEYSDQHKDRDQV